MVSNPKVGGKYWYIEEWNDMFHAIQVRVTGSFEGPYIGNYITTEVHYNIEWIPGLGFEVPKCKWSLVARAVDLYSTRNTAENIATRMNRSADRYGD